MVMLYCRLQCSYYGEIKKKSSIILTVEIGGIGGVK
jgi:hypothetical protein